MNFFEQFNQFLLASWEEVVQREKDNRHRLYLYRVGEFWVAFEKSAYRASECFPSLDISSISLADYPYPVLFVCLPQSRLAQLPYSCSAEGRTNRILFSEQPLSVLRYRQWRSRELFELA